MKGIEGEDKNIELDVLEREMPVEGFMGRGRSK